MDVHLPIWKQEDPSSTCVCCLTKFTTQQKLEGVTKNLARYSQLRYSYEEASGAEFKNSPLRMWYVYDIEC